MVRVANFWMPKQGHTTSEYEDAFAMSDPETLPFRAAVADGATESAFSGAWARRLTAAFVSSGELGLTELREGFHRISTRGHVPWYLEEKTAEGSHAAFAGLELQEGRWSAKAVGDCCLFHIRNGERLLSWPLDDPKAFSSTPNLLSSRESSAEPLVLETSGSWEHGDRLILATDALAAWILGHGAADGGHRLADDGHSPAHDGRSLAHVGHGLAGVWHSMAGVGIVEFGRQVERARDEGSMRNDDVTAIVIDL